MFYVGNRNIHKVDIQVHFNDVSLSVKFGFATQLLDLVDWLVPFLVRHKMLEFRSPGFVL